MTHDRWEHHSISIPLHGQISLFIFCYLNSFALPYCCIGYVLISFLLLVLIHICGVQLQIRRTYFVRGTRAIRWGIFWSVGSYVKDLLIFRFLLFRLKICLWVIVIVQAKINLVWYDRLALALDDENLSRWKGIQQAENEHFLLLNKSTKVELPLYLASRSIHDSSFSATFALPTLDFGRVDRGKNTVE